MDSTPAPHAGDSQAVASHGGQRVPVVVGAGDVARQLVVLDAQGGQVLQLPRPGRGQAPREAVGVELPTTQAWSGRVVMIRNW